MFFPPLFPPIPHDVYDYPTCVPMQRKHLILTNLSTTGTKSYYRRLLFFPSFLVGLSALQSRRLSSAVGVLVFSGIQAAVRQVWVDGWEGSPSHLHAGDPPHVVRYPVPLKKKSVRLG